MMATALFFTSMMVIVRFTNPYMTVIQILLFRSLIGIAVQAPWMLKVGWRELMPKRPWLLIIRSVFVFLGLFSFYNALIRIPLADATALHFSVPLFVMLLAVFVLKEKVGPHRWIGLGMGVVGALVIIRPGFAELSPWALLVILSALFYAIDGTCLKILTKGEKTGVIVLAMNVTGVPIALVLAMIEWQPIDAQGFPWVIALAVVASTMHYTMTRAFKVADVSFISPFGFVRLPLAAAFGYVIWNEVPDQWTWIGAAIIFAGGYYIAYREGKAMRRLAALKKSAK